MFFNLFKKKEPAEKKETISFARLVLKSESDRDWRVEANFFPPAGQSEVIDFFKTSLEQINDFEYKRGCFNLDEPDQC